MLDKSVVVSPHFCREKATDFEHLDTITVTATPFLTIELYAMDLIRSSAPLPPGRTAAEAALTSTSGSATPQTYIKGSYFRGYLHREVATVRFTRFERARIIGARALQISMGAPVLVDIPDEMIDPIEISIVEFDKGAIPMTVKRED